MIRVLLPTDFSNNAMNACKYALELFKYVKSEVYFLHAFADEVYKSVQNTDLLNEVSKQIELKSEEKLAQFIADLKKNHENPNYTYNSINAFNSLIDEVDKIVDDKNIDVIVMGTKGITSSSSLTFGSNAMQILRYVKSPVLLIPHGYTYKEPTHIVLSTDFMIQYNRRELELLNELVHQYKGTINILQVSKSTKMSIRQENNKLFVEGILYNNKINFIQKNEKDIAKTITQYINKNDISMLVMVNTRHSYLENILFKTTIDKVGLEIAIPFLALQNINRCK